MKKYSFIIILFLLVSFNNTVHSGLREVSLDECIGIAIQNHPEIKASDEDVNVAIANYGAAKSRSSPIINFEIKTVENHIVDQEGNIRKPKNDVVNIPGKDTMIGLFVGPTLTYNLIDPQRTYTVDSARLAIDLAKMRALKIKADIILNVKKSYYAYLFAQQNKSKREQLVEKFHSKLEIARILFKTGQRPILDVTKSDVDLADARLEYEKAKNYENIVKTELLAAMGIMKEDIDFSPIKIEKLPELRFPLKKIYQLAENNNPEIKMARMSKDIHQINVSASRAAHYPFVDFLGAVGITNSDIIYGWQNPYRHPESYREKMKWDNWRKSINAGLSARVNIWSGGGLESKVDSKIAEFNKSKYIERDILINTRTLITNYFQIISEFKKQIELSEFVIDNSQKHLMLAKKSYENGIGTQLELQDAEMILLKSELGFIKVGYDYLIIMAKLSNIVGLGEEYICIKK